MRKAAFPMFPVGSTRRRRCAVPWRYGAAVRGLASLKIRTRDAHAKFARPRDEATRWGHRALPPLRTAILHTIIARRHYARKIRTRGAPYRHYAREIRTRDTHRHYA